MKRSFLVLNPTLVVLLLVPALVRCASTEDGSPSASAAQCMDWSRQASIGRRAAQDEAGRACSTDVECEIVDYGLRCFADCGYASAVASSAIPALETAIEKLDEDNCDRFQAANCSGPIIPPCVSPDGTPSAVCRSSQCTLELTPYM